MATEKLGLVRKLNVWHIWALGTGAVIGDGIFLLIGQGASAGGPSAMLMYAIAGLFFLIIMMAMTELAVGMPTAGSFHVWGRRILSPGYGYLAGMCYIAMNIIFLGSVGIAIGIMSNWWFQWTADPYVSAIIWAVILISLVVIVNLSGVVLAGRTQLILVGVLVGIMVGFAISGAASGKIVTANYHPFMPFGLAGAWIALGMGTYAYMGPLTLLTTAGECRKVTDLPKGLFWACMTFIIVFGVAQLALLGLVNYSELGVMESPFTYAATGVWGVVAATIMNIAAWIAAFTCLLAEVYCGSRLLYGMAEEKGLPSAFARVSRKTRVPWFAIVMMWIAGLIIVVIGNISALEGFYVELCMMGCEAGMICWIILLVAAAKYKTKFSGEWQAIPWHLPARKVVIPLAFPCTAFLLWGCFSGDPLSVVYIAIFAALMVLLYFAYARKRLAPTEYL